MRYNKIITLAISCTAFALTFSGCMRNFLERNPYGVLDENTYFTKAEHADLAAMACYSSLQKMNGHWADAQLELGMTGDFSSGGFKDAQSYYGASFNPNDASLVKGIWRKGYEGIAMCNNNLKGIEHISPEILDDNLRSKYLAEIRFVKAFWYFRLIRFYGDIPLRSSVITNPKDEAAVQLPVTPQQKIIDDIILPDLEYAHKHLPNRRDAKECMRATKGAALALLTEVCVHTKQYDKAIQYGEELLSLGYSLISNPGNVLRVDYENSSEIIFAIGYSNGVETYREYYYGTIEDLGGEMGRIMRGDTYSGDYFYPSKDLIDFYQAIDGKPISKSPYYNAAEVWKNRDPRFDTTFFTPMDEITTTSGKSLHWQPKWLVNNVTGYDIQKRGVYYGENNWNKRVNNTLIRLPRVYLLLAEAYAQKSSPDFSKVNEYVNKTRKRARVYALAHPEKYIPQGLSSSQVLPDFRVSSVAEVMVAINYESRVEFFTEDCIRYFDLKRWGNLADEWSRIGNFSWQKHLQDLPYPSDEISNNRNIHQKEGWGN